MSRLLKKVLKEAVKERQCVLGSKKVLDSISRSKLVVISQSAQKEYLQEIEKNANEANIPTIKFQESSVALGRLCGLQFRVSAIAVTSITDANIKSILSETENE